MQRKDGVRKSSNGGAQTGKKRSVRVLPTHWLLDYFAHRPDLRLYPGGMKVGLGMRYSLPITVLVEFGFFLIGLLHYGRATRSKGRGSNGFRSLVLFLAALYAASLIATTSKRSHHSPEGVGAMADGSLGRLGRPPARAATGLTSAHEKNLLPKNGSALQRLFHEVLALCQCRSLCCRDLAGRSSAVQRMPNDRCARGLFSAGRVVRRREARALMRERLDATRAERRVRISM